MPHYLSDIIACTGCKKSTSRLWYAEVDQFIDGKFQPIPEKYLNKNSMKERLIAAYKERDEAEEQTYPLVEKYANHMNEKATNIEITHCCGRGVSIGWEEFWAYGGHEKFEDLIPWEYFDNPDAWLKNYDENKVKEKELEQAAALEKQKQNDLKLLEELKSKYEN